ncbi:MAG: MBL fold metallo-hydrolase [Actinobacteria bacterium]|nr:MBL fold metallo-hydrolase [Actinomycetota bacterium]
MADDDLYFRQLLSGHDFAVGDPLATQMANFVYLIGDRRAGECVIVDPAYGVDDLVDIVEADGLRVTGVLATHYHPDHVGGSMMGYRIEGVARLLERIQVPIHVNENEVPWVTRTTGLTETDLCAHTAGDSVRVGSVDIDLVHTPGHTPGSQCFHVHGCLISGDTLFLDGCGRTDLPGSNPDDMFESLQRLDAMPSTTIVYPGHRYSPPPSETLQEVRSHNFVLKPKSKEQWLTIFGGG